MRICQFEDSRVAHLEPLSLTRPAFDLLCGQTTLGTKQRRHFSSPSASVLIRPYLTGTYREQHRETRINDIDWLRQETTLFVNARWLPPTGVPTIVTTPHVAMIDGQLAYAVVPPALLGDLDVDSIDNCVDAWKEALPALSAQGHLIEYPWHLIDHNADALHDDFAVLASEHSTGWRPASFHLTGPANQLFIDPSARLDPLVVADTTNGPVIIDRDAVITAFTRLEGPCYIGRGTHILGAKIRGGTSIGPNCRIGGEVEASIILGHTNKYHDGFLGHSYVGEWVNLAAGSQTSDLRCDYGEVNIINNGRKVATNRRKLGSFIGDHTKTGLGTLMNTGSNIGVFCNLLPTGELLPKYVPSFCQVAHGRVVDSSPLNELFATAAMVMSRRGVAFTPDHMSMYLHLFDELATQRRLAQREAEQRRLRQSA